MRLVERHIIKISHQFYKEVDELAWRSKNLYNYANYLVRQSFIKDSTYSLMPKAIWNGAVLAESDNTVVVENNHYFPADSINKQYFTDSSTHSTCPWKGVASYYSIDVDGQINKDAAWYYPSAKEKAKNIEGYVAFWKGVKVEA